MEIAAVFAPLLGAMIAGFFGRWIEDRGAQLVTCAGMFVSAISSILLFDDVALHGVVRTRELFTWIDFNVDSVSWALRIDTLSVVMLVVVSVVSTMVHVYSIGYMSHDPHKSRFMSYLSLFSFCMLMLVTSDNLLQMFFGWEGVGLCSYLLINFWFEKPSANSAAIKAFIVNRVGDFGFSLGIVLVFIVFKSIDFDTIFETIPNSTSRTFNFLGYEYDAITLACLLLFTGAMGKSAQLGLHTWLPDAMEGPTPVSALIHAATMVTAGVFMIVRLSPLFEHAPLALSIITVVGALTAFVAGTIGLTQFDIKRVIAYSTMSQLGYMFFAVGVSAYSAAVFHLFTHAFFKALLFLGAGSVIHALSGEQDMRKMGGVWSKIPVTYAMMWIGNLALAGLPFFAGFYSKDMILEAAYASQSNTGLFAFWLGIVTVGMTAFYSWRLLFLTFHGKSRASHHVLDHAHEAPKVMLIPLCVLAIGAIFTGMLGEHLFVGSGRAEFWGDSIVVLSGHDTIERAHHGLPVWVGFLPLAMTLLGIGLAFICYIVFPGIPAKVANATGGVYRFLYNKWYFDVLYQKLFVNTSFALGFAFWKGGDNAVIDKVGPDGLSEVTMYLSGEAQKVQTGYVSHYAFAMVIGVALIIGWLCIG
ncbi:NADH-quinone oxidoreductase subunit L [Azospirillaceae bacterium]